MLAIGELGEDKPAELVVTCLVRARMCELLAPSASLAGHAHDLFLVGLLSLVDALVGRPLAELVREMALSEEIQAGNCVYTIARTQPAHLLQLDELGRMLKRIKESKSDALANVTLLQPSNQRPDEAGSARAPTFRRRACRAALRST